MNFSIDEFDNSEFECLKLPDQSYYYGNVQFLSQQNKLYESIQSMPVEEQNSAKKVRHGAGVQLYITVDNECLCKYEGMWQKDQMHGLANIYYSDKSEYHGNLLNNQMSGYGTFKWSNGNCYEGNWLNGRLDGGGKFTTNDGQVYQGMFKNNYFQDGQQFLNTFMQTTELQDFVKNQKRTGKIKESNYNKKQFRFQKSHNLTEAKDFVKNSLANNRIPFFLSSQQLLLSIQEFKDQISRCFSSNVAEFNLRDMASSDDQKNLRDTHKQNLARAMVKGDIFILNVDESNAKYDEIFDPDFKQFFSSTHFPQQIWNLNQLCKPNVYEQLYAGTEQKFQTEFSQNFKIFTWSKLKIDQNLSDATIIDKVQNRFKGFIPIERLDIMLLCQK